MACIKWLGISITLSAVKVEEEKEGSFMVKGRGLILQNDLWKTSTTSFYPLLPRKTEDKSDFETN